MIYATNTHEPNLLKPPYPAAGNLSHVTVFHQAWRIKVGVDQILDLDGFRL